MHVNHPNNDVRLLEFFIRALDTDTFNSIGGFANTCRVNKAEGCSVDNHGVFNDVARSAVNVGNDGALFAQ